jgi:CubicO group peptidase (beta-lactamase class C family)
MRNVLLRQIGILAGVVFCLAVSVVFSRITAASAADGERRDGSAEIPAVSKAMQKCVDEQEIAGAVTLAATRDKIIHLGTVGKADIAADKPMETDTMFWIASMTKPIAASAVLMLQDEGKLSVDDPVAKYLPELANLKTTDGRPAALTLKHLLTHTSGMGEATPEEWQSSKTLAELIPHFAEKPLAFEPGTRWQYCQSGINTLGRIVEVVSGKSFPEFLEQRLFGPLGMKDTTFYPNDEQLARLAKTYRRAGGKLEATTVMSGYAPSGERRFPAANGGLFSTAADYGRFCQMILNEGTLDRKQYLTPGSVKLMTSIQTGDIKTGFTEGNGWGLGWCVVRKPDGVTGMLSPGTFGHGGAYGTQAWIDPEKGVIYVLMVQRADFPNADASDVRRAFQSAVVESMGK